MSKAYIKERLELKLAKVSLFRTETVKRIEKLGIDLDYSKGRLDTIDKQIAELHSKLGINLNNVTDISA